MKSSGILLIMKYFLLWNIPETELFQLNLYEEISVCQDIQDFKTEDSQVLFRLIC